MQGPTHKDCSIKTLRDVFKAFGPQWVARHDEAFETGMFLNQFSEEHAELLNRIDLNEYLLNLDTQDV